MKKLLISLSFLGLLIPGVSFGAIAFDRSASQGFTSTDGSNNITLSYIQGSITDAGLGVILRNNANSDQLVSVKANGVSMTQAIKFHEYLGGNQAYVYGYYLAGTPSGAYNIVANFSGSQTVAIFAHTYSGISQSAMLDNSASAEGITSALAIAVTTIADNSWVMAEGRSYTGGESAGTGMTGRQNPGSGNGGQSGDNGAAKTPAGSVSETVNATAGYMSGIAMSFAPSVSTPVPTGPTRHIKGIGVSR